MSNDTGILDECDLCGRNDVSLERRLTPLDGFLWMCDDCLADCAD